MKNLLPFAPVFFATFGASLLGACGDYAYKVPGAGGTASGATGGTGGSSGGTTSAGGSSGSSGSSGSGNLPCDIFQQAGHPCVSAHSTVRALVSGYTGNLYQVKTAKGATLDIGVVDGYADIAAQDAFCAGTTCVATVIYDQSPHGNHLTPSPPGSQKPSPGDPASIGDHKISINGRMAYGLLFKPGMGYRTACDACTYSNKDTAGTAVGDEPESMYMVTSSKNLINGCCFDYGNAERTANNDGNGTMEAVYLGQGVIWGTGSGDGPWVMADLENGLYAGWENQQDHNISTALSLKHDFVTAVVVGDTADKNGGKGRFALYGGDATMGMLDTMYDGIRPEKPGYVPMRKQGSIILSIGGDNSDGDGGRFYEGVMVTGAASKETVDALQASILAAGYGK
jgi:hypothetical protein